jgi:TonB family protein
MMWFMKTRLALVVCLALVPASTVSAQTPNAPETAPWNRYTIKGEEFSVMLPAAPSLATKKGLHANKVRLERTLTSSAGGVFYAVYTYENPTPKQSLADFITEQTTDYRPELLLERTIELNGFVGREYKSLDKNRPAIEQFFATNEHNYRFAVNSSGDNAGAKQFFSSIRLGQPEGIDLSDAPDSAANTTTGEKIYLSGEVDTKARITKFVPPEYTDEAKKHRVIGVVILKAVLSSTGEVTNVRVISGLPYGLSDKAIEAAQKLKFVPAMKDGKYVSTWLQFELNFSLF